jgi:cobalamin biosynthesis Co2+ chelatase CbiK
MSQKNYLILDNEFIAYCKLNNIDDVEKFAIDVFNRGFNIIKYGETPKGFSSEKIIEKIVEKEVIKEVPIEKIVEVIKEVPVTIEGEPKVIIKEVEIINDVELNKLKEEMKIIKEENEKMKTALDSFGKKGKLMRNSNLSSLYDE